VQKQRTKSKAGKSTVRTHRHTNTGTRSVAGSRSSRRRDRESSRRRSLGVCVHCRKTG